MHNDIIDYIETKQGDTSTGAILNTLVSTHGSRSVFEALEYLADPTANSYREMATGLLLYIGRQIQEGTQKNLRELCTMVSDAQLVENFIETLRTSNQYNDIQLWIQTMGYWGVELAEDDVAALIGTHKYKHPLIVAGLLEKLRLEFSTEIISDNELEIGYDDPEAFALVTCLFVHYSGIDLVQKINILTALSKNPGCGILAPYISTKISALKAMLVKIDEALHSDAPRNPKEPLPLDHPFETVFEKYGWLTEDIPNTFVTMMADLNELAHG